MPPEKAFNNPMNKVNLLRNEDLYGRRPKLIVIIIIITKYIP